VRTLKFVWVDDQPKKIEDYRKVIEVGVEYLELTASIEAMEVRDELLTTMDSWSSRNQGRPPDLFIIDHVFNTALPFRLNGSSVAHLLRNTFPRVPIVCVTAKYDDSSSFDQEDLSEYTALFLYKQLELHVEDLYVIARDFRKLSPVDADVRAHLIRSLKPPRRDREDLLRVLPEEFQDQKHVTTQHHMGRWICTVLLRRPGFLYDRLRIATLLGLTEAGFNKVEPLFAKALYRGVFATHRSPIWWVSEVYRLLFNAIDNSRVSVPQIAGRALPGISPSDFSTCYVSKTTDPPPDAVVMTDATSGAVRRVVRREFAKQHPRDLGVAPGFETRLVLAKRPR